MEQQALVESQARVEEVEEEQAFIDLDIITKHGITKTDVNKFKDAGFLTVSLYEVTKNFICLHIISSQFRVALNPKAQCQRLMVCSALGGVRRPCCKESFAQHQGHHRLQSFSSKREWQFVLLTSTPP
jgi:hypothetical protein